MNASLQMDGAALECESPNKKGTEAATTIQLVGTAGDGAMRLRELILSLAVRGKLVAQDSRDRSADAALERMRSRREKGALAPRKGATEPDFSLIQRGHKLPSGWAWSCLGQIGTVNPRNDAPDDTVASFVQMSSIPTRLGEPHKTERRAWGDIKSGFTHFQEGDVALAKITPCFENGKSTVLSNLGGRLGAGTTELHVIRPFPEVEAQYLLIFLKSPDFLKDGQIHMTGSAGQKRLPRSYFETYPFPFPPLAEQKRIAARVGVLMRLVDALEASGRLEAAQHVRLTSALFDAWVASESASDLAKNWRQIAERFDLILDRAEAVDRFEDAILDLAVRGLLTSQDASDEPVSVVLSHLQEQGGNGNVRRRVPENVRRPESIGDENLPPSWAFESTARLLQLGAIIDLKDGNHGANHPKTSEFTESGVPFITAAQVSKDGKIDYEGAYKVPGKVLQRLRVGFAKPGDVIFTHKGSVGRVAICHRDCVLSPQTTYYRLNKTILSAEFVRLYLLSRAFRSQVDIVKRQTTRDFVSINAQYHFFIRIPPLPEQHRIVDRIKQLRELCAQLRECISAKMAVQERLADAALATAVQ
jgi:type I restriction enzyme, S subunit